VQSRRDTQAAKRLLRKLLKRQMRPPRVMITDKLPSYGAAKKAIMPGAAVSGGEKARISGASFAGRGWLSVARVVATGRDRRASLH